MSDEKTPTDELVTQTEEAAESVAEVEEEAAAAADAEVAEAVEAVEEAEVAIEEKAEELVDEAPTTVEKAEEKVAKVEEKAEKAKPERKSKKATAQNPVAQTPVAPKASPSPVMLAIIACAALLLGVLAGKFMLGGGSGSAGTAFSGKLAVAEEKDLDATIATFTYKGTTTNVTAREVIDATASLDATVDEEGNYTVPSADAVLSYVRNSVLEKEAAEKGIVISDEDLAAYAEETLGTSDYESIGTTYGMDKDAVVKLLTSSALMSKLRESVIGEVAVGDMPEAPVEPATDDAAADDAEATDEAATDEAATDEAADDAAADEAAAEANNNVVTKEYADYIINLAGDEWDSEKGGWVAEDGPYASALSSYDISAEGASYEAATTAYYVAYQLYSESQTAVQDQWADYVNGLLSQASVNISTLVS